MMIPHEGVGMGQALILLDAYLDGGSSGERHQTGRIHVQGQAAEGDAQACE